MEPLISKDNLPSEVKVMILQYVSPEDLCHVAACSRSWREASNDNALWRPLCRGRGWERYGNIEHLCKEIAFRRTRTRSASQPDESNSNGRRSVTFPFDSVVTGSDWPGLVGTSKWKEVYMKAKHLEGNWRNNRYKEVTFEFGSDVYELHNYIQVMWPVLRVLNLDGEGDCLAGSVSDHTLHIWDMASGKRRHLIKANVSKKKDTLKMKNGVIAAGCRDGKIRTYSTRTGKRLQVISGHRISVSRLFFDGDTIVSVAQRSYPDEMEQHVDSDIRVWSSADGVSRFTFSSSAGVRLIHLDYLDKTVAAAYSDQTIRLLDVRSGACKRTIVSDANQLLSCHLGNGILITTYVYMFQDTYNSIKMWNVESGECTKTVHLPLNEIEDKYWSYKFNGELLLGTAGSSYLRMIKLDGKHLDYLFKYEGWEYELESTCLHGGKLFAADIDGGGNHLWMVDPHDGFHFVKKVRNLMTDDWVETKLTAAWMSDTKLAFVDYREVQKAEIPKIIVHRYW